MIKVSIIIPVYNAKDYLRECLDSVVNQTLQNIEIICIDDGSTDGSDKILEEYAQQDNRLKIFHQENQGASAAKNKGIENASGEFVAFMDSDDLYPDCNVLKDLYNAALEKKVNICGGSLYRIENNQVKKKNIEKKFIFTKDEIISYTDYQFDYGFTRFIYKKDFLVNHQIKFPYYKRFEDPPFFIKTMSAAGHFYALARPSYYYRHTNKKINWNVDLLADVLKGYNESLKLAEKLNYNDLFNNIINRLNSTYMLDIFYPFHRTKNIVELIDKMSDRVKNLLDKVYLAYKLPKFSVIISVYNTEKYLAECLNSVLNQTEKNIEIICVNDGSTDNSFAILNEFAKKDKRIIVINQKNEGLACSRNKAMKIAKGEYITFLDADDYWSKDILKILYKQLIEKNLDMLSFGGINFDNASQKLKINPYYQFEYLPQNFNIHCFSYKDCKDFILKRAISSCLTCYNRKFLADNNIVFPPHLFFEDNVFFTHAFLKARKCGICKETLYFRRVHSESITQNWNLHFDDYLQICQKVIDLVNSMPIEEDIKNSYQSEYKSRAVDVYNRFNKQDKNKFAKKLKEFIQRIRLNTKHKRTVKSYKLFGFIPLLSIDDK